MIAVVSGKESSAGVEAFGSLFHRFAMNAGVADRDVIDEQVMILFRCPRPTVIDVDPNGFDFQPVHVAHADIVLLIDQFVVNPRAQHSIMFAGSVHFDVLFDAVPAVRFQSCESVALPIPVFTVFAGHVGVIAIEANWCSAVPQTSKQPARRPTVLAVHLATAPTGASVGSGNSRELAAARWFPVCSQSQIISEIDFFRFPAESFFESISQAQSVMSPLVNPDSKCLSIMGYKAPLIIDRDCFGSLGRLAQTPFAPPGFVLKIALENESVLAS